MLYRCQQLPTFKPCLWALEWASHPAETNWRCARCSQIYMPNAKFLPFIVFEITAFIRANRQTDRWTDGHG